MGYFTDDFLRRLRNDININEVIGALGLETRRGTDLIRFQCPLCHGFHTVGSPGSGHGERLTIKDVC